jgi:hypothetical protein
MISDVVPPFNKGNQLRPLVEIFGSKASQIGF